MKFGDRLKSIRMEKNLSQEEFAKLLNTSKQVISRYERHERTPKITVANEYAKILNVSLNFLLGEDNATQNDTTYFDITKDPSYTTADFAQFVPIPLVGTVRCGEPIFAKSNIKTYIPTSPDSLLPGEDYFWLKATGDSMINAGIFEGDLLLIRKQSDVDSGCIAVVAVNGDTATLKRIIKKENAMILQPENTKYETKIYVGKEMNAIHIIGRLMESKRKF